MIFFAMVALVLGVREFNVCVTYLNICNSKVFPFVYIHEFGWGYIESLTDVLFVNVNACRLRTAPACVPVRTTLSQYGVVWVVCMQGLLVGFV